MNARQRCLAAYGREGQPACLWCGEADVTQLQLDHIEGGEGQGRQHRRWLTSRIEYDLQRQYQLTGAWPEGFRTLCQSCHLGRHGKEPRMPPRQGHKRLEVSMDRRDIEALHKLAVERHTTVSQLIHEAIMPVLYETPPARLHTMLATVLDTLAALTDTVREVRQEQERVKARVTAIEGSHATVKQTLDHLEKTLASVHERVYKLPEKRGILG